MKTSVELCINKLSDAAAKSELRANCEKFDSELGELRTPDVSADLCVSSGMAFWKGTERVANWSSPHTKRETGEKEPTTGASLCLASQEECMLRCRANNWTKAGWYPVRFSSRPWHYRTNFHYPANFRAIQGACQRRVHMFCRPRESLWPGSSWKYLGVLQEYGVDGCLLLAVK